MRELLGGIYLFIWLGINGIFFLSYKKGLDEAKARKLFIVFNIITIASVFFGEQYVDGWMLFTVCLFSLLFITEKI